MAALFESDRALIAGRIASAEQMVLAREHQLFRGETDVLEKHALNSALHALRALRTCLGLSAPDGRH
jgi:hypothetical protein